MAGYFSKISWDDMLYSDPIKAEAEMLYYSSRKKDEKESKEDMNIRRISEAIRNCPREDVELAKKWINGNPSLSQDEKRIVSCIVLRSRYKTDIQLSEDFLEKRLVREEKESDAKWIERASALLIEAYMSPGYRGFLKHLICNSIPGYRRDYTPDVSECEESTVDSLTGESIEKGDLFYNVVSSIGDVDRLREPSYEALKRADMIMKRAWKFDYFYNR